MSSLITAPHVMATAATDLRQVGPQRNPQVSEPATRSEEPACIKCVGLTRRLRWRHRWHGRCGGTQLCARRPTVR